MNSSTTIYHVVPFGNHNTDGGFVPLEGITMERSIAIQPGYLSSRRAIVSVGAPISQIKRNKKAVKPVDSIYSFLFAASFGLVAALLLFIYPMGGTSWPEVVEATVSAFKGFQIRDLSNDELLAKLVEEQGDKASNQVQYVLDIIRSTRRDSDEATKLALTIVSESLKANYDPLFVASVIKAESTFNRDAVSGAGAKGLMQILPNTGRYVSERKGIRWDGAGKLHDPSYNLQLGIAYLKELEAKYGGNREKALIAYNWGPGNLLKAFKGELEIPSSSLKYARSIISRHSKWQHEFNNKNFDVALGSIDFKA